MATGSAIVCGVMLTAYQNPDFELRGFLLSLLATFATAMSTIIAAAAMATARQLPPVELSMHMSMWASMFCTLPFLNFEMVRHSVYFYGMLHTSCSNNTLTHREQLDLMGAAQTGAVGTRQFVQLTFGIFIALMLNVSKYAAVHRVSATAFVALNTILSRQPHSCICNFANNRLRRFS
eukprot:SAG31_NODE_1857_length_7062_cov_6.624587_3_plen_178_part_00